jgi:hypothetical protein
VHSAQTFCMISKNRKIRCKYIKKKRKEKRKNVFTSVHSKKAMVHTRTQNKVCVHTNNKMSLHQKSNNEYQ